MLQGEWGESRKNLGFLGVIFPAEVRRGSLSGLTTGITDFYENVKGEFDRAMAGQGIHLRLANPAGLVTLLIPGNVNIKQTIAAINQLQADGVIQRYAIGGAVGATFYLEPAATLDVDVFVTFRADGGSLLVSVQPIFDYLKAHGGTIEGEYIVVGGWPVQFLPAADALVLEALDQAIQKDVADVPAWVFTAEHLAAIALQTGRAKDKARLLQFIEAGALELARFQAILVHHGLAAAWQRFEQQFLGGKR